jgi:two-component system, NarL family, response regulator
MSAAPPIRLLIADDHPVTLMGLVALCASEPDLAVCAKAANGVEAVRLYEEQRPDVALLDLRMPEMDGIQATIAIRRGSPQARIVILSTFDSTEEIYQALQAGARGYLLKHFVAEELLQGVRAVNAGGHCIPPLVAQRLADRGRQLVPSGREIEVLRFVAKGFTNKEIAAHLSISPETVRNHMRHLFEKLDASDRSEAVVIALERGFFRLD